MVSCKKFDIMILLKAARQYMVLPQGKIMRSNTENTVPEKEWNAAPRKRWTGCKNGFYCDGYKDRLAILLYSHRLAASLERSHPFSGQVLIGLNFQV